jgi:hypothetical protein
MHEPNSSKGNNTAQRLLGRVEVMGARGTVDLRAGLPRVRYSRDPSPAVSERNRFHGIGQARHHSSAVFNRSR